MPPTRPEVLFLARQAGTALAFTPLLDAMAQDGEPVRLAAIGAAAQTWADRDPITGERFADVADALRSHPKPGILVTGTSADPADDARSWSWARERQIPTVAFVDSWVNYRERFTAPAGGWVSPLPDLIACIDDVARDRLRQAGLPEPRLRALGSPAFDALAGRRQPARSRDGGTTVLFASQPLAGRGFPTPWDEHRALDMLLEALGAAELGPVTVVIRLHGAEPPDKFSDLVDDASSVQVVIDTQQDRVASVVDAHLVAGVVTMLQVEARWLGRPVISLQAGGHVGSDLIDGHAIPVFQDATALASALRGGLVQDSPELRLPPPSIPRWRAALDEIQP